jgi:molybdenum cofactor synthesis domain-containing protein
MIGSEVLSGKIADTNGAWLARFLYSRGVDLVRLEVIPDQHEDVVATVRRLSTLVGPQGYVFTSGGIGPTHDDVTYAAIAEAFQRQLQVHDATLAAMTEHYTKQGKAVNDARLRMATLPSGCAAHTTPGTWVPIAQVENVFVLPGIPHLFTSMLSANKGLFSGPQLHSAALYTTTGEGELADALRAIAKEHPAVSTGSYPNTTVGDKRFSTKLAFDARDEGALAAAVRAVRAAISCTEAV